VPAFSLSAALFATRRTLRLRLPTFSDKFSLRAGHNRAPVRLMKASSESRLVLGLQPVREAIRIHRERIRRVCVESRANPRLEAVARFARDQGVREIDELSRAELDRLAGSTEHQGLACWAPPLQLVGFDALLEDPHLLAVALDEIQDPHNFGAIVRCAVGIAGAAVFWGEHASAPLTPATFRASAGAIEQARLCRVASLRDALGRCRAGGITVVGLEAKAPRALHERALQDRAFTGPTVLVLGSEHRGLGRGIRASCSEFARLELSGQLDSLNVSVAAGIALHTVHISRSNSTA
jgi:23S rRNA (guanosine2251-2'-O)-methyltransferase